MAARGTGTIDSQPGTFGFVFYAYQGCQGGHTDGCQPGPDSFRAVVWPLDGNPNPGGATVYDNSGRAAYDVDVAEPQPLQTGTVSIHPPP